MIKAIDFFCGAGGLTRGLLDVGIKVLAGIDIDARLRETYEANNWPSRFMCTDIKAINIQGLRSKLGIKDKDKTLYAACTPCQPFSTLNQRQGADNRKELLISFAEIVQAVPPTSSWSKTFPV
jgi:DNA (cytosine-5)-methyltransferase 1